MIFYEGKIQPGGAKIMLRYITRGGAAVVGNKKPTAAAEAKHRRALGNSYVVYMGAHSHDASSNLVDYEKVTDSHYDFLGSFLGSKEKAKDAIFCSYTRCINGFAANLEAEEAQQISRHPNVISVFLSKRKKLHTTRSWGFLGLERDGHVPKDLLMNQGKYGEGVIIANIDTGMWPESESFNDTGLGPAPPRWKGTCETNTSAPVKCNRCDCHIRDGICRLQPISVDR